MIPEQYVGMVIVGIFTISSSLATIIVSHILTGRREEKKREEEYEQRRNEAAHEYFRGIYNYLAPILAISCEFDLTFGERLMLGKTPQKEPSEQIKALQQWFQNTYEQLANKGLLALFPTELRNRIFRYGERITALTTLWGQKDDSKKLDDKVIELLLNVMEIGREVRSGIRRLLNVDSLDSAFPEQTLKWKDFLQKKLSKAEQEKEKLGDSDSSEQKR